MKPLLFLYIPIQQKLAVPLRKARHTLYIYHPTARSTPLYIVSSPCTKHSTRSIQYPITARHCLALLHPHRRLRRFCTTSTTRRNCITPSHASRRHTALTHPVRRHAAIMHPVRRHAAIARPSPVPSLVHCRPSRTLHCSLHCCVAVSRRHHTTYTAPPLCPPTLPSPLTSSTISHELYRLI